MSRVTKGSPEPLGATLDESGANFAVFSAHAEAVELCLFDARGEQEVERILLAHRSGDVFHAHVAGLSEGARYGLRAYGPFDPRNGHRFNPAKLLVDPYALRLDRAFALDASMLPPTDQSRDELDSAPVVPKAILTHVGHAPAVRPKRPWNETILYELHVKGFTKRHPDVPEELRGTFAGLAHEASIAHLTRLGVTAVELMPCAAWLDERHLTALGLTNYWGYNPIAMMAPDPRLAPGGWAEVAAAVATLHEAGLEVIVDVVFNHTGEGDAFGPTVSLRGLDNATYYRLADDPRDYVNDAGCGNIPAFDRAPVVRYAMDALRAWVDYGGVDGFRFDLATTLARRREGFDSHAPFLAALMQDPVLRELKLIAEPWDIGPGGYQLGNFPAPMAEWNDRFRDCARRFWRGDAIGVAELATRVSGSADVFAAKRLASRSVNFITAHDGFTLHDLVSYAHKHNEANGEHNRDGADNNSSWNNGVEGATDDAAALLARLRDQRALLATLLLSRGTPMVSMGAESGFSQGGNNNAYAQDNETAWLDWVGADTELLAFTARLIDLRKKHRALAHDRFLSGEIIDDSLTPDVEWRRADGVPMSAADWHDDAAQTLVAVLYAPAEGECDADRVAVVYHRGADALALTPPPARDGFVWRLGLESSGEHEPCSIDRFSIAPRSVALLVEAPDTSGTRAAAPIAQELLSQLAQAAGVALHWRDVDGAEHEVPRETIETLLASMDLPSASLAQGRESLALLADRFERRATPQSVVMRDDEAFALRLPLMNGRTPTSLLVALEEGGEQRVSLAASERVSWRGLDGRRYEGVRASLPRLPLGRHLVTRDDAPEASCLLTIAPRCCFLPRSEAFERGAFGLAAQLYSLRRDGDQGVGDFTTLAQLSRAAAAHGAALVAINPLHALFAQDRERASPYYPSDRRFLDPIYLDLEALGGVVGEEVFRVAFVVDALSLAPLRDARNIDYPQVWNVKRRFLEQVFTVFDEGRRRQPDLHAARDFAKFIAQGDDALWRFACFEAISEARGGDHWRQWPQALSQGRVEALLDFEKQHSGSIRFHCFLQWLCERQLARASEQAADAGLALGFCRDLAVGAAPDGAECWSNAAQLLEGFSVGAPPDAFSRDGQSWGLPPPDPLAWRADGCAVFSQLLRANMRHAGALRIDHVMALARLFVVPDGAKVKDGAYLSYPLDDLLGCLALESARAKCFVVGEDLGTLPWGFREKLDAANVLSYRVVYFERQGDGFAPPSSYPRKAMACVSTHDLPTLEGWWRGADIDEKAALGLLSAVEAEAQHVARRGEKHALLDALRRERLLGAAHDDDTPFDDTAFDDALAGAVHAYAARTPSVLAMAQVDDLAGEVSAVNLPGTDRERPNWRRKLNAPLADLFDNRRANAILSSLRRNVD